MVIGADYEYLVANKQEFPAEIEWTRINLAKVVPGCAYMATFWLNTSPGNMRPASITLANNLGTLLGVNKQVLVESVWSKHHFVIPAKRNTTDGINIFIGWSKDDPNIKSEGPLGVWTEPLKQLGFPQEEWKTRGLCPKCGELGQFRLMALVCSSHGVYGGC